MLLRLGSRTGPNLAFSQGSYLLKHQISLRQTRPFSLASIGSFARPCWPKNSWYRAKPWAATKNIHTNQTRSIAPNIGALSCTSSYKKRRWWLASASAVAFQRFDDDDTTGRTRESRMLEQSLTELEPEMPESLLGKALFILEHYVWESLCTFLRFLQLASLFGPVILSGPIVLVGFVRDSDGTTSGALLWYAYLRWTMEMAGSSFIKLGQWAASRADIFPRALCEELGKLHSQGKSHSLNHTRREVKKSFGKDLDQVFSDFSEEPIGVGAMGQVYKARFRPDVGVEGLDGGQWVVVKVLHPKIRISVDRDLKIMMYIAKAINALPTMEWLSLPGEVETFGIMMRSQLDLRIEAENLRIFQANFASHSDVAFPTPYPSVSSRDVLVEELINAVSMEKIMKRCKETTLDREIAAVGLDSFLKMLLIDNFIHSDLHPGNIFVRFAKASPGSEAAEKQMLETTAKLNAAETQEEWDELWEEYETHHYKPQVCFIDAGLVTELTPKNSRNFVDLFKAIATFDGYRAGELMVERSRTPETAIDPEVFALRTQKLVDQVKKRTFALGSVNIGDLLTSMMDMVRKHHVRNESDFITVVLSILLLEGIGRQLNPDLDIFKSALPILRQVGQKNATTFGGTTSTDDLVQMTKVWLMLEVRQFINASIQDIHNCVKYDVLSPNE